MYKELTKNVSITIHKDRVYLHLKKYRPIVISAEDMFRKGVEVRTCSKCRCFKTMVMSVGKKKYCSECTDNYFKSKEVKKQ